MPASIKKDAIQKNKVDGINSDDPKYGNGMKTKSYEGSTTFVSSLQSQLEQRHVILERVAKLSAGTLVMQSKKEKQPTTKVRQWVGHAQ